MDDATTFCYDWRRDNNESADRFICYLEQIKQRHAGRPPQVIAHSNGGAQL
jgi:alpha-beta hydrolase superfamily lysophospholipase